MDWPPNSSSAGQQPNKKGQSEVSSLLNRILAFIESRRYGAIGAALAGGAGAFAGAWTLCEAFGVIGSKTLFLTLILVAVVVFSFVHWVLLHRSLSRLRIALRPAQLSDVREELDTLLPRLDHETAIAVQGIVSRYEDQVHNLQDQLTRIQHKDIPGVPVLIEAGAFTMGADSSSRDEQPPHDVKVTAFLIDRFPVTNQQYFAFVNDPVNSDWLPDKVHSRYGVPYYLADWQGSTPPTGIWYHAVVHVSWYSAVAFCNWRSRQENLQEVYTFVSETEVKCDFSKSGWRLPTEAEWEKAARAGRMNCPYPWSGNLTPTLANYGKHHRGTTPVGQFPANAVGLFDMLGNVKEWCHDWYSESVYAERQGKVAEDPWGPETGTHRTFRGGSWMDNANWIRIPKRDRLPPENMNPDFGFRCVRRP